MDDFFFWVIVAGIVSSVLGGVFWIVVIASVAKLAVKAARNQQAAAMQMFAQFASQLEEAKRRMAQLTPEERRRLEQSWQGFNIQNAALGKAMQGLKDANELNRLRGEMADLRISQMKSDAASLGLFLD
jgi:uncharacterized protein (DUF3084 family)